MNALLGRKLGMMSIINEQGLLVPLTVLKIEPNFITQVKTKEVDNYDALQISTIEDKKVNKPQVGHFKKASLKQPLRVSREVRLKEKADFKLGSEIKLDIFKVGDQVTVTGTSKGKGFAGGIKRYNFSRLGKSHGHKGRTRTIGSIGAVGPQKVFKGKKMPGRLGGRQTTIKGLKIGLINEQKRLIGVKGALPGSRKALIMIKKVGV